MIHFDYIFYKGVILGDQRGLYPLVHSFIVPKPDKTELRRVCLEITNYKSQITNSPDRFLRTFFSTFTKMKLPIKLFSKIYMKSIRFGKER
jgi:hypothetical protein